MNKTIIGIVGQMAAGKGTAAQYLKEKHRASTYTFSTMLRDALNRFYLEPTRDNFIKMSEIIRGTFGEDIMARTMAHDVENDSNELIVVEGVRREADIEYLSRMDGFVLVEIAADIETRYERMTQRGEKSDDASKTFEEFKADHERSTERSTVEVAKKATERIDNNGSMEQLHTQLDELIAKYAT